ncbi:NACHT domain-containing protein [Phormidium sp. CLA17]|uniref:NACHT domain-containing protein n=1 Tax=Leptolyngbya sp. Cla-17 TaxID=2803751 RepID=UPI0019313B87|nr:NACHT domain-containing protein [Leptolyngbya sp. Cla-17]MBM0742322.1 NACHT domain-containing protein [Leptolyngbya sp. Cla-17]
MHTAVTVPLNTAIRRNKLDLISWITTKLKLADLKQTKQLLNNARVLLLLDGLDEVPEQWQKPIQARLRDFFDSYDQVPTIVTCRTQTTEFVPRGFECVEIAEFKPKQIKAFAYKWFTAINAQQGNSKADLFLQLAEQNKPAANLMEIPLLLSLACWIFQDRDELPSKRSELYEQGLDLLLEQWDEIRAIKRHCNSEVYKALNIDQRKDLLSHLAHHKFTNPQLQSNGKANFILFHQSEIENLISEHLSISRGESYKVLKAIESQHGLLVARAWKIWSFSHLTFQEYFAAHWFVQHQEQEILFKNICNSRWREVFLLITEMLDTAEQLLCSMKHKIDELLEENDKLQEFLQWINEKVKSIEISYKPEVVRACYFINNMGLAQNLPSYTISIDYGVNFLRLPDLRFQIDSSFCYDYDFFFDHFLQANCYHAIALAFNLRFSPTLENELGILKNLLKKAYENMKEEIKRIQALVDEEEENKKKQLMLAIFSNSKNWKNQLYCNGHSWDEKFAKVLNDFLNFDQEWQFDPEQTQLLRQYYDANQLLVDCLNSACYVSREVRQEIEDTLLLPISAALENRQQ